MFNPFQGVTSWHSLYILILACCHEISDHSQIRILAHRLDSRRNACTRLWTRENMPVRHAYLLYVAHDEVKLRYGDVSSHGISLPPVTRIKKAKGAFGDRIRMHRPRLKDQLDAIWRAMGRNCQDGTNGTGLHTYMSSKIVLRSRVAQHIV